MDAENQPAENGADAVSPVANDKSAARWGLILLVLCAVGAGLVIGILALQVTEYLFYKAPPGVWPQPGVGGTISAPATFIAPVTATTAPAGVVSSAMPVTATASAVAPAAVPVSAATTAAPSAAVTSSGVTSMPAVAATSAPAPVAATP